MRKVTGYIGALIVVVALMGSILAGYALNINGQSTVVNEYENVTDVSGLYSHTNEKTYIDYNPASNYIGYKLEKKQYDNAGDNNYKKITNGTVKINRDKTVIVNGVNQGTVNGNVPIFCTPDLMVRVASGYVLIYAPNNSFYPVNVGDDITITISNGNVTAMCNGTFYNKSAPSIIVYNTTDPDYNLITVSTNTTIYTNEVTDVMAYMSTPSGMWYNGVLYQYPTIGSTQQIPVQQILGAGTEIADNVVKYDFNKNMGSYVHYMVFVPKKVTSASETGIDYSESNRVNNYIIGYREIGGTPVTTSSRIDLQSVSTYNYATPNKEWIIGERMDGGDLYGNNPDWRTQFKTGPVYSNSSGSAHPGQYKVCKFTDFLTSIALPQNTKTVTISAPKLIGSLSDGTIAISYSTNNVGYFTSMPYNFVAIGNYAGTFDYNMRVPNLNNVNDQWFNSNIYRSASYDIESGLVNVYDSNGAKIITDNVDNIYIQYIYQPAAYGYYENYNINTGVSGAGYYHAQQLPVSYLDVGITTSTSTSTPIYMDITKGIKIDPGNISDTIWTNEYENGQIQLLFRAEDTYGTYHNEFSVSDNTISVDYTGGRFYVSLNGAEQIDVGAWRNILLNIDLLNGNVSVNPVRTFNSYTNVSTDKAVINIGDMVNPAPATTMVWKSTANSFTFSVYATNVFLNTYGVVMVNPSLTITNYFTDLNNFYRLVLNNFSTYGDSITVNDVTGNVSGNTITFNDESITLKNVEIIYADGHVYVEDDNDSVDLGTIANNDISLSGVWYFETDLDRGYTALKQIYTWDWTDFVLDNTQFCIFYIGLALVGLVVARRFCVMTVIDYAVFIISIIIALSTQVIV